MTQIQKNAIRFDERAAQHHFAYKVHIALYHAKNERSEKEFHVHSALWNYHQHKRFLHMAVCAEMADRLLNG